MRAEVIRPRFARVRACDCFSDGGRTGAKFCFECGFARALHVRYVPCSQCGGEFKAPANGDNGYSMCVDHGGNQ